MTTTNQDKKTFSRCLLDEAIINAKAGHLQEPVVEVICHTYGSGVVELHCLSTSLVAGGMSVAVSPKRTEYTLYPIGIHLSDFASDVENLTDEDWTLMAMSHPDVSQLMWDVFKLLKMHIDSGTDLEYLKESIRSCIKDHN